METVTETQRVPTVASVLERARAWGSNGREDPDGGFPLGCRVVDLVAGTEMRSVPGVPREMRELWAECSEAYLFEDVTYGQWGLHLLSPQQAVERTEMMRSLYPDVGITPTDLAIGEFLGDLDILFVRPSGDDELTVSVLEPLAGWEHLAFGLAEFLNRWYDSPGKKYWEINVSSPRP